MEKAFVNKIINFSSVDGVGNRTVIFLQGCNFDCIYCHNPETKNICISCKDCINVCPIQALSFNNDRVEWNDALCVSCDACIKVCKHKSSPKTSVMTTDDVIKIVKNNIPYIRGITVSGGECTLQASFLIELFKKAKAENLSCLIDSNGSYNFENDKDLTSIADGVMLDIKAYDKNEHYNLVKVDNTLVLKNALYLASLNKLPEIRTVVVPNLFNVKQTVTEVCKMLKPYSNNILYKVIKYRPFGVSKQNQSLCQVPSDDIMCELNNIVRDFGFKTTIV